MSDEKITDTNDIKPEEIFKSVELKIDETEEAQNEVVKPEKKKVDVKTEDKETNDLYAEFSSFLEDKIDMKPDSGVKSVIPTGIDILDAILGGGLAIGALDIIVGQPGTLPAKHDS